MEGKINNAVQRARKEASYPEFLDRVLQYWKAAEGRETILHPTFKTDEEKKALRNKRARLARAKKKCKSRKSCSRKN